MPPLDDEGAPASSAGDTGQNGESYLDKLNTEGAPAGESPAPDPDAKPTPDSSDGEAGAETPPAEKSSLDVVKDFVKANQGDGDSPRSDSDSQDPKGAEAAEAKPDGEQKADGEDKDKADDPDKDLPFHNHPRWKEVVAERDKFKARAEELEPVAKEAEQLKQHATGYQEINNYLASNNLNADDFTNGLNIMALMKNSPQEALKALEPYYHALERVTGKVLPDDIKKQVDDGTIDEQTGYSIAQERARAEQLAQQNQRLQQTEHYRRQQEDQSRQRQEQQAAMQPLVKAAESWEQEWQKNDPDYNKLVDMVRLRVSELVQGQKQPPQTPEEVQKVCEQAKTDVYGYLNKVMPQKTAQKPLPDGAGTGGNPPHAQPKTSLEAAKLALRQ